MRLKIFIFLSDLIFLLVSFTIVFLLLFTVEEILEREHIVQLSGFVVIWFLFSYLFNKYETDNVFSIKENSARILKANIMILLTITSALYFFEFSISRPLILGVTGILTVLELITSNVFVLTIKITPCIDQETIGKESIRETVASEEVQHYKPAKELEDKISSFTSPESRDFIFSNIAKADLDETLFVATHTRFNIEHQSDEFQNVVNLKRINHVQRINKLFETINVKLPENGLYIGSVETYQLRKERILKKYPWGINKIAYTIDFIIRRILPKLFFSKSLYFFFTRGRNRVISKAETFGRLYSCGFEIINEEQIGNYLYFAARKVKEPFYDMNPTYGPFIKLRRVGKNGELFNVFKLRTMHPYAEYLQDYIYQKNSLDQGGKFKDDFRVTSLGKIFRKIWLDELPMIFNLLKGDMKLVGVRPISMHYFNLYTEELKEKRTDTKPGLLPPFYLDLPKTLPEIIASELRYLDSYAKSPLKTDFVYFWKIVHNIFIKKARSQ
ncbi:MAG: sugar transferase [Bacteroidetes bacterium]|nr:sugar transferase [Bacteroidota bacterium]